MIPNILFVNLPYLPGDLLRGNQRGSSTVQGSPLTMPMGILYLSAYLKKHVKVGTVVLLDYRLHTSDVAQCESMADFFRAVARENVKFVPDIIGVSLNFSTSSGNAEVAMPQLASLWPEALIVVGGTHATNTAAFLLNYGSVDYVVCGEGEIPFTQLVRQFAQSERISVRGVYGKDVLRSAAGAAVGEFVTDLDSMPFPDWELLDMERYTTGGRRRTYGEAANLPHAATMITTRGCPYKCTFCSNHTVHGRKVRTRSVDSIVSEMKTLHERYGVTTFIPEDDLFTANRKRLLAVLDAIKKANIPGFDLQLGNGLSVEAMTEEVLDALVSVGIRSVTIAIESGSEYVQRAIIKKNVDLEKAKEIVRWSHTRGLIVRTFIMFGFPYETKPLMQETVQYMRDLGADWHVINLAEPLVGTEMYEIFLKRGCFVEGVEFWSHNLSHERRFDTDEICGAELTEFYYRTNLEINFLENTNLRNGNFDRAVALFADIANLYPFHIFAWYGLARAYKGKGDLQQAGAAMARIAMLIQMDRRSREMYEKFGYLVNDWPPIAPPSA